MRLLTYICKFYKNPAVIFAFSNNIKLHKVYKGSELQLLYDVPMDI